MQQMMMMMVAVPDLLNHDRLDASGLAVGVTTELSGLIPTARSFAELSPSGLAGDARTATAARGGTLFGADARSVALIVLDDRARARCAAAAAIPPPTTTAPAAQPAQS